MYEEKARYGTTMVVRLLAPVRSLNAFLAIARLAPSVNFRLTYSKSYDS